MHRSNCPNKPYTFFKCKDGSRCIPIVWQCDKVVDCLDSSDEQGCLNPVDKVAGAILARHKAAQWFLTQRNPDVTTGKWGAQVHRIAVALYLTDEKFFAAGNTTGEEITYELSIRLLGALFRDQTEPMSTNELALYLHALLATCLDARDFQGINIVDTLRQLVETQDNYTNPFVLLTLCNAHDTMTENDVQKLTTLIKTSYRPFWADIRALALMALTCIAEQSESLVDFKMLDELAIQLKLLQSRTGVIQSLHTTALVTQALFAAGKEDGDEWDMEDSIKYLIMSQSPDGSYENLLNSYYVLPTLQYKSLLNVSADHCKPNVTDDEAIALDQLRSKLGTKIHIVYSLWFGDNKDFARSLKIRTLANSTFFDVMKLAAALDFRYRFKYTNLNAKPYVDELSRVQNDPEKDMYWFLYITKKSGSTETAFNSSPIDVIPKDNEEFIMWYKTGEWNRENSNTVTSRNVANMIASAKKAT